MNTATKPQNKKVIPLHTEQTFYYWMTKSINRLKTQGNTSRLLIIGLIIWNIFLTIPHIKTGLNTPQFDDKMNKQIMIEENIPFELEPIPLTELA